MIWRAFALLLGPHGALGATFLLAAPSLTYPLGADQAVYSYLGEGVFGGFIPYRDSWAQNAPGNFLIYGGGISLFGDPNLAVYWMNLAAILAGTALIYSLAARLLGRPYAGLAALLYGGSQAVVDFGHQAEPETFMAVATMTAVFALTRSTQSAWGPWAIAGLATAAAILLKPTGLATVLIVLAYRRPHAQGARAYVLGTSVPITLVLLWLVTAGALPDMWDQVFRYNAGYVSAAYANLATSLAVLAIDFLFSGGPMYLLGAVGLALLPRHFISLWAGIAFVTVAVQSHHHVYHWYWVLPPAAMLGAFLLVETVKYPVGRWYVVLAPVAAGYLALCVYFWWPAAPRYASGWATLLGRQDPQSHLTLFRDGPVAPDLRAAVVRWLNTQARQVGTVFVLGEPGVYAVTRLRAPTRYFHEGPFHFAGDPAPLLLDWSQEIQGRPPDYVVVRETPDAGLSRTHSSLMQILGPMLERDYSLEARVVGADIFRRVSGSSAAGLGPQ